MWAEARLPMPAWALRLRRRLRPKPQRFVATAEPRARIHLTGAGGSGIITALAITAAAANTANNLLYLLLGLLLSAYAISAWASRRAIARLTGELVAPREMRAGVEAGLVATVRAQGASSPAIVLDVRVDDGDSVATTALSSVPPRGASETMRAVLARRGPARLTLVARSPFPFGLVEGFRSVAQEDVLVLPAPDPSWRRVVPESGAEGASAPRKGEGSEVFNIRDYAWGEDARHMDWKATARLSRPMLREHARDRQRAAVIVIEHLPAGDDAELARSERAISRAAGAAEELAREGWHLRLIAPGADVTGDDRALLRALARLQPGQAAAVHAWRATLQPGDGVLRIEP